MDKRIIWFALIVFLIAGGIFAWRYYKGRSASVERLSFSVTPLTLTTEDSLAFEDNTTGAKSWRWDFGDGNGSISLESKGVFRYFDPGHYTIRLTVNGKTTDSVTVTVNPSGPDPKPIGEIVRISGPKQAFVGDLVTFTDNTPGAKESEWTNLSTGERKKGATYTTKFMTPGIKKIRVTNEKNMEDHGTYEIKILEKPVPPSPVKPKPKPDGGGGGKPDGGGGQPIPLPPPPPSVKRVSEAELLGYFKAIAAGDIRKTLPKLRAAVNNNNSIQVDYNNKGAAESKRLYGFCTFLDNLRPSVTGVKIEWDEATNTIRKLTVNLK